MELETKRLKDAEDKNLFTFLVSQITNFVAGVRGVTLGGLNIVSGEVTSGDSILSAFGKILWKLGNLTKTDVGLGNVSNVTSANLPISTATQTALDAKADLVSGKIPTSQIPAVALVEFLGTVANQTAMLGLTGQRGDWCIRSDNSKTYVLTADNAAILENWQALAYPASASGVNSVNGQTGIVVLGKSDIGLGNVPNADTTNPANITENTTHRFVTDTEKATWNAKQAALGFTPVRPAVGSPEAIAAIWCGTQAQYDALGSYSSTTFYVVKP